MIQQKEVSVSSAAQSINTLLGTSQPFTKIRFGLVSGVQYGGVNLDVSTNPGINLPANFPVVELEFDSDDDPGNNLFLASSNPTNIPIFVW